MNEKDLLEFLIFIAEEDAQISTIIRFFNNQLGYEVNTLKHIVEHGVKMDIFQVVENDEGFENYTIVKGSEISEMDWSISNVSHEIYYKDIEYYRKQLLDSNSKIPNEFRGFIKE